MMGFSMLASLFDLFIKTDCLYNINIKDYVLHTNTRSLEGKVLEYSENSQKRVSFQLKLNRKRLILLYLSCKGLEVNRMHHIVT